MAFKTCGQMMAERQAEIMGNFIERSALWYRLERIGESKPLEDFIEGKSQDLDDLGNRLRKYMPEWNRKQWDKLQQLESEVKGWRPKHYEALTEIDRLTKLVVTSKKKKQGYKQYA